MSCHFKSKSFLTSSQVLYRYTRAPHIYSDKMCSIELTLNNLGSDDLEAVKVGSKRMAPGASLREFSSLGVLKANASACVTLGVDFNDSTQAASFDLVASGRYDSWEFIFFK